MNSLLNKLKKKQSTDITGDFQFILQLKIFFWILENGHSISDLDKIVFMPSASKEYSRQSQNNQGIDIRNV